MISPVGVVSTIAGTGFPYWDDGPADEATFYFPQGVAVVPDGSVIYVTDGPGTTLRKITVQ